VRNESTDNDPRAAMTAMTLTISRMIDVTAVSKPRANVVDRSADRADIMRLSNRPIQ